MNISKKNSVSLDDICYLITTKIKTDKAGIQKEKFSEKMIFCAQISPYRSNLSSANFIAGTQNIKDNICLLVISEDYSGETQIKYSGKTYCVTKIFPRDNGFSEIYLSDKIGVLNAN